MFISGTTQKRSCPDLHDQTFAVSADDLLDPLLSAWDQPVDRTELPIHADMQPVRDRGDTERMVRSEVFGEPCGGF